MHLFIYSVIRFLFSCILHSLSKVFSQITSVISTKLINVSNAIQQFVSRMYSHIHMYECVCVCTADLSPGNMQRYLGLAVSTTPACVKCSYKSVGVQLLLQLFEVMPAKARVGLLLMYIILGKQLLKKNLNKKNYQIYINRIKRNAYKAIFLCMHY